MAGISPQRNTCAKLLHERTIKGDVACIKHTSLTGNQTSSSVRIHASVHSDVGYTLNILQ